MVVIITATSNTTISVVANNIQNTGIPPPLTEEEGQSRAMTDSTGTKKCIQVKLV